jgi:hypothetical protein
MRGSRKGGEYPPGGSWTGDGGRQAEGARTLIEWLWDAEDPGEFAGVTDSEAGALSIAEELRTDGRAEQCPCRDGLHAYGRAVDQVRISAGRFRVERRPRR